MLSHLAHKRLPLTPQRTSSKTARYRPEGLSLEAGDLFWKSGVNITKVVYTAIDARYPLNKRMDKSISENHAHKMGEAKKILNEHRSDVVEAVMPMFSVSRRGLEPEELADEHARGYIITLLDTMTATLIAWLPVFVEASEVDMLTKTIENVAELERSVLIGKLRNYKFSFRQVATPD